MRADGVGERQQILFQGEQRPGIELDGIRGDQHGAQGHRQALRLADRAYVLETGRIVLQGSGRELLAEPRVQDAYLGG